MKKYEGIVIFNPTTEEETRNSIIEKFQGIIESNGSVEKLDEWGSRKLAYEIDKYKEGYYVLYDFQAEADVVNELDRVAKITDEVIRHMIVRNEE